MLKMSPKEFVEDPPVFCCLYVCVFEEREDSNIASGV